MNKPKTPQEQQIQENVERLLYQVIELSKLEGQLDAARKALQAAMDTDLAFANIPNEIKAAYWTTETAYITIQSQKQKATRCIQNLLTHGTLEGSD